MKPQTIRIIDLWLGRPICLALTVLSRLGRLIKPRPSPAAPTKILLVKLIEQGATVLAYRAIERAVTLVGRDNVYFLVFKRNRFIFDLLGLAPPENVIEIRDDSLIPFLLDTVRALVRIRKTGIDAAVDMEFFARASAILTYLSGARLRVGLHRFTSEAPYRGDLFTHRVQYNPYLHTSVGYYVLVDSLIADPRELPMPKIAVPSIDWCPPAAIVHEADRQSVREIIEAEAGGPLPGNLVLLNPNAGDLLPLRRWATERFVEVAQRLLAEQPKLTIGITGGPDERDAAAEVTRAIASDRAICLAGRTTLSQLLVLYSLADVMVTNDSGPGHFASLTSMDTVVLFGPETPTLFGPLGPRVQTLSAGLACSPCVSAINHRFSACRDNRCMSEISVDEVCGAVDRALDRRNRRVPVLTILPPATRSVPARSVAAM